MKLSTTAKSLLGFVALAAVYFAVVLFDRSTTKPGTRGQSIDGFLQSKRTTQKMERLEKENQQYIFVTGRMTPLWFVTIPSGPPCYVFDANGQLIDWTVDVGDDPRFQEKWPSSLRRGNISIEDARKLFHRKLSVRAVRETSQ